MKFLQTILVTWHNLSFFTHPKLRSRLAERGSFFQNFLSYIKKLCRNLRPLSLPSCEPFPTEEVLRHLASQVKKKWVRNRHYTISHLNRQRKGTLGSPQETLILWQDYFSPLPFLANDR